MNSSISRIPQQSGQTHLVELTSNEVAWLDFLRRASDHTDPVVTLRRVQFLQRVLKR
jgi:hypothetical protein